MCSALLLHSLKLFGTSVFVPCADVLCTTCLRPATRHPGSTASNVTAPFILELTIGVSARDARGFPLFGGHGMNFPGMHGLNMDHITTQLMEAHQPAIYATKRDVLAALPRLRVAGRGDAPGQVPEAAEAAAGGSGGEAAACSAGDPCTVCHDDIGEGTIVVQLPCKHCFHEECILPWLEVRPTP